MTEAIQISALEHFMYCERQAALISVDGVWADNHHVVKGHRGHKRVDSGESSTGRGRTTLRRVRVWSEVLGLTGVADAVEVHDDGSIIPVEYKMGARHGRAAEVQVAAQALCLEEMLDTHIEEVAVWYGGPRRRSTLPLNAELRDLTLATVNGMRGLHEKTALPTPPNDARCAECQLLTRCLPSVVTNPRRLERYVQQEVFECNS